MGLQNLHTHTTFCDGTQPPDVMIEAALQKGCDSLGFSDHSYVSFDLDYSMTPETTLKYISEINALKTKHMGEIEIFLGIEQDYFTDEAVEGLDYRLGTVHHVKMEGVYVTIDAGARHQQMIVDEYFGGDYFALAETYFETKANVARKTNPDIIGHFDLIAKYNIANNLFDEMHTRYVNAALGAMDEILKDCKLFEVNTGAMYRFGKPEPYPSAFLLKELYRRGGEVILSSDSHDVQSLCHKFDEMRELLKTCGFKYTKRLTQAGFIDIPL